MKILLISRMIGAVPEFLGTLSASSPAAIRIAYVDDAAQPLVGAPFVSRERAQLQALGYSLDLVTIDDCTETDLSNILDTVDAVYVAGGLADHLMEVLRRTGADKVLAERVRAGLPYIGASAGAMIMGTSIGPAIALDGRTVGVSLEDLSGLGLVDAVILPHADGQLPPYPPEAIATAARHLEGEPGLTLLRDDEALLVDNGNVRRVSSADTALWPLGPSDRESAEGRRV